MVFSDIHYDRQVLRKLETVMDEADYIVFTGDGILSVSDYLLKYDKKMYIVKGNCDSVDFDRELTLQVEDVKFFITHGDRYSVKNDLSKLSYRAEELGCDVALFGHTHQSLIEKVGNVTLINSGSLSLPNDFQKTYCYIVVNKDKFFAKIVKIG